MFDAFAKSVLRFARRRWVRLLACCTVAGILFCPASPPRATGADVGGSDGAFAERQNYDDYYAPPKNFGLKIGEFNGVPIYCNGPMSPKYFSNEKHEHEGYITGYKWQCVEFIVRFYKQVYGQEIRGGDAYEWFDLALEKNLKRYPNGDRYKPEVGDILCSESGRWGHVGIIREVGPDYVVVIQQNWHNTAEDGAKRAPMTVKDGICTIHPFPKAPHYKWQGWMRSKTPPLRQP